LRGPPPLPPYVRVAYTAARLVKSGRRPKAPPKPGVGGISHRTLKVHTDMGSVDRAITCHYHLSWPFGLCTVRAFMAADFPVSSFIRGFRPPFRFLPLLRPMLTSLWRSTGLAVGSLWVRHDLCVPVLAGSLHGVLLPVSRLGLGKPVCPNPALTPQNLGISRGTSLAVFCA
jgi:hypothetical protein